MAPKFLVPFGMFRTLQLPVGFELVAQEQHHIVSRMRQDVKSQNAELPSRKHTAYLLHSYSVNYVVNTACL
jgi:hypothetical protein